ncbi:MAG TPA: YfcE family phosphodiesterase [Spirochaetota bacterium]|nr:YfcE family phosphodiesterase [Spirochaetota bacterium]HPJ37121.1 YfcE family phosphodiesterase [Spirochaetota bacterium]HPQ52914.1 YfcE family phosphodiesterase [Spirochaetota bacterium]
MLIGIIADTHNEIEMTEKALNVLRTRNVEVLIHAGDLTSPRMLELFKDFKCRFVLGNSDIDAEFINMKSEQLGFGRVDTSSSFEVDGKKFFIFHGNDVPLFRKIVALGEYDYIIKGHTHFFEDYVSNTTRIINPGTLYGNDEHTIALLDTEKDKVEKIKISEDDM